MVITRCQTEDFRLTTEAQHVRGGGEEGATAEEWQEHDWRDVSAVDVAQHLDEERDAEGHAARRRRTEDEERADDPGAQRTGRGDTRHQVIVGGTSAGPSK